MEHEIFPAGLNSQTQIIENECDKLSNDESEGQMRVSHQLQEGLSIYIKT